MNISLIFNISYLIKYYEGGDESKFAKELWSILATSLATKEIEEILDSHIGKITRNKTYEEYLVKWKGRLVEDSSWLAKEEVECLGFPLNT